MPFYIAAAEGRMKEFATFVPDEATQELWRGRSEVAGTLDRAEAVAHETFDELCRALETVPDARLNDLQPHPMDPARQATTAPLTPLTEEARKARPFMDGMDSASSFLRRRNPFAVLMSRQLLFTLC